MHNIKANFDKILEVLKDILSDEVNAKGTYVRRGTVPKFADIEVIALSLTAECLSIDSENYLFSKLNTEYRFEFKNIISRRQYNDRRKLLFEKTEVLRKLLTERLNEQAYLPLIPCRLSSVSCPGKSAAKWARSPSATHRIKATVLHRKNTSMVTSSTAFVLQRASLNR